MKREFLEGKNLSFVLLLPSSITGKSVLAGGFAVSLVPSNLLFVPIVAFLDSHVDPEGTVKNLTVTHERIRFLLPLISPSSPLHNEAWGSPKLAWALGVTAMG